MKNIRLSKLVCGALLGLTMTAGWNLPAEAADTSAVQAAAEESGQQQEKLREQVKRLEEKLAAVEGSKQSGKENEEAIKTINAQLKELQQQIEASSEAQERIMEALDDIQIQNKEYESLITDPAGDYAGTAATDKYLLYPGGNAHTPSYTQDAINAQGNSTMVFAYAPNQIYKIYCRRGYLTDLAFHKGESIRYVGGGDTVGWAVSSTTVAGVPHLYIKPIVEVSTTNLIVTTDKHSYQLIINSSDWYNPMVTWSYDAEDAVNSMLAQQKEERISNGHFSAASVENLDFNYKVRGGNESDRPSIVFSDGEKTYMQFPQLLRKKYPLFIRENGKKDLSLVNYKAKGSYLVVEKIFNQAQLRISDSEVITIQHRK